MRKDDNPWLAYILSFVPSLMIWYQMGDESTMLAYSVSLIFALVFMLLLPRGCITGVCSSLVAIPVVYWLIGLVVFVFAIYSGVKIAAQFKTRLSAIAIVIFPVVYALVWLVLLLVIERILVGKLKECPDSSGKHCHRYVWCDSLRIHLLKVIVGCKSTKNILNKR